VSAIIGAGIVPAAIGMMDALAIGTAEAAVACHYPAGSDAVFLVELDGPQADVVRDAAAMRELREWTGATEIREADDPAERARHLGRPQVRRRSGGPDLTRLHRPGRGPRTALGAVLDKIAQLPAGAGIRVANVFHAGEGNLHPLVLYDDSSPAAAQAAEELSGAILDLCVSHDGSITCEHSVDVDKSRYMLKMFGAGDLDTMQLLRCAFDPGRPVPARPRSRRRARSCGPPPGEISRWSPGAEAATWAEAPRPGRCDLVVDTLQPGEVLAQAGQRLALDAPRRQCRAE